MSLERITPNDGGDYIVLGKISNINPIYLCMFQKFTSQTINNKSKVMAFDFKNLNQFKGQRPFFVLNENKIIEHLDFGFKDSYDVKLFLGSVVDYAGIDYIVVGYVVNNYAQWNIPTPVLLNPKTIIADLKNLYQGRLLESEIIEKINDNFQNGKYDSEMLIPLVDSNDFKKEISIIKERPKSEEINLYINKIKKNNNLKIKTVKDVFIDTILDLSGDEIQQLREMNEDVYDKTKDFMNTINKIINSKIKTKPKKEIDLSFLDVVDELFNDDFMKEIDNAF